MSGQGAAGELGALPPALVVRVPGVRRVTRHCPVLSPCRRNAGKVCAVLRACPDEKPQTICAKAAFLLGSDPGAGGGEAEQGQLVSGRAERCRGYKHPGEAFRAPGGPRGLLCRMKAPRPCRAPGSSQQSAAARFAGRSQTGLCPESSCGRLGADLCFPARCQLGAPAAL